MQFCQDIPWLVACGGNTGEIAVWDTSETTEIEDHFKPHLAKGSYNPEDYDPNAVAVPEDDDEEFEDMEDEKKKKKDKKSKKSKKE
jgi:hypothetical protein